MSNECPICLELLSGNTLTSHCCNKEYHVICYIKCMEQKQECPMCRKIFHEVIQIEPIHIVVPQVNFYRFTGFIMTFVFTGSLFYIFSHRVI